jgi:hypothetical protein
MIFLEHETINNKTQRRKDAKTQRREHAMGCGKTPPQPWDNRETGTIL